jgi:hypothetical protein
MVFALIVAIAAALLVAMRTAQTTGRTFDLAKSTEAKSHVARVLALSASLAAIAFGLAIVLISLGIILGAEGYRGGWFGSASAALFLATFVAEIYATQLRKKFRLLSTLKAKIEEWHSYEDYMEVASLPVPRAGEIMSKAAWALAIIVLPAAIGVYFTSVVFTIGRKKTNAEVSEIWQRKKRVEYYEHDSGRRLSPGIVPNVD